MNLFETILQEANKDRFLSKLYAEYKDFEYSVDDNIAADFALALQNNNIDKNNYYEPLLAFVNSNASDKYKFNWQRKDSAELWREIIEAFTSYLINGTKSKTKKLNKENPKQIFYNSGLKVINYGDYSDYDEELQKADFVLFNEQENDKFIFVGILSHKAAVFCDSFQCGGAGAKWCIGYASSANYWDSYSQKGSTFVLAYNKKGYGLATKQKYMLQISEFKCDVWKQDDSKIINAKIEAFGLNQDILQVWNKFLTNATNQTIKLSYTQKGAKFFPRVEVDGVVYVEPEDKHTVIPIFDFMKLLDSVKINHRYKLIAYSNEEPIHINLLNGLKSDDPHASLCFSGCNKVQIDIFYLKDARIKFGDSNVVIDNLCIPFSHFDEEELEKYRELIVAGDIPGLTNLMAKYGMIAADPFYNDNRSLTVNNVYIMPRDDTPDVNLNPTIGNLNEVHRYIVPNEAGKIKIEKGIIAVDINCYNADMSNFTINDKIIINEIIKPTTKLKAVKIYNYDKSLIPIWTGDEELRPGKFYMLPCYSKIY